MTDEQFAAEVRQHQRASWRPASLFARAKAHAQDFAEILGHPLTPTELDGLSRAAIWSWDRLFTELDKANRLSYIFFSRLERRGGILVVATREGLVRTAFPIRRIDLWLRRHSAAVEATDRARGLGL